MHILFLFCPKNFRRYRSQICVFIEKRDRDRKINRETAKDRKLNCDREAETRERQRQRQKDKLRQREREKQRQSEVL